MLNESRPFGFSFQHGSHVLKIVLGYKQSFHTWGSLRSTTWRDYMINKLNTQTWSPHDPLFCRKWFGVKHFLHRSWTMNFVLIVLFFFVFVASINSTTRQNSEPDSELFSCGQQRSSKNKLPLGCLGFFDGYHPEPRPPDNFVILSPTGANFIWDRENVGAAARVISRRCMCGRNEGSRLLHSFVKLFNRYPESSNIDFQNRTIRSTNLS